MPSTERFPYETRLNILHGALEKIDVGQRTAILMVETAAIQPTGD